VLALALLRDPRYRNYWLALFLSQLGTWMQAATQGWLVLELTGSAERLGLVTAFQFLPSLLFTLPAGVISDRYPRRTLLMLTQTMLAVLALGMALLIFTGLVRYEHVLVFALLYGVANAIDLPVRQAYQVELAGRERYPGAIALNSFGFNTSRLLGPAIAGMAIAAVGMQTSYLINGLSFLPMLWLLRGIQPSETRNERGNLLREAMEGIGFVLAEPLVRQVILLIGLTSLFGMNFQTIVPAYARLELGLSAQGYGFLMSAVGLGSLMASLIQALAARAIPVRALIGAYVVGLALISLGLEVDSRWTVLLFAISGLGMITTMINCNTTVQMSVPDRLRGRVMSVYSLTLLGVAPLGGYLTGFLMDALGGRGAVMVMGALTVLSALSLSFLRWPRAVEEKPRG
jgi:MFS family permease